MSFLCWWRSLSFCVRGRGTEQIHSRPRQHNVGSGITLLDRGWIYSTLELPMLTGVEQVWVVGRGWGCWRRGSCQTWDLGGTMQVTSHRTLDQLFSAYWCSSQLSVKQLGWGSASSNLRPWSSVGGQSSPNRKWGSSLIEGGRTCSLIM